MDAEQWAPIREAPGYDVSSWGRVRRGAFDVATWPNHKGYIMASLEVDSRPQLRYVHRLVMIAFRGSAAGRPVVNHGNGHKGDNHLDNLGWSTHSGNVVHRRLLRARLVYGQRSLLDLLSA